MKTLHLYTDGGSRGNPGESAIGVVIADENGILKYYGEKIGLGTNNEAEYKAVISGLNSVLSFGDAENTIIEHFSDSQLIVNQLNGDWKIKEYRLRDLYTRAVCAESDFAQVTHVYAPREHPMIQAADEEVNKALDS
jgi:ribonuclease HI